MPKKYENKFISESWLIFSKNGFENEFTLIPCILVFFGFQGIL